MRHRRSFPATVLSAGLLIALLLFPDTGSAQFDTDALKKKAEKALKGGSGDKVEKKVEKPAGETSTPSADGREVLGNAARAISPLQSIRSVYKGMYAKKNEAQKFYDACRQADYPAWRTRIEQAMVADPGAKERDNLTYDDVMVKFPEHFSGLTKEYLIPEINGAIETAYAEKTKGASRAGTALEAAESAVLVADGILLVTPDNADVPTLREDARSAVASMGAARDAVFASAFNKEHAGEIVFSSEPVIVGSENPAAMKTAFTANEYIYAMMYFRGTFQEVTNGSNYAHSKLLIDGNENTGYDFKLASDQATNTWLKSEIIPDPEQSTTRGATVFTKAISSLSPRRHTVILRTVDDYGKTIAEGTFQLDCTAGLDRVAGVHKKLNEKKLAAVKLPEPAMRNAALENECIAALKEWKETPLKVIITDADWTIQHHPITGAVTSRTINTSVAFKKPDGGCRMFVISFRQQYQGRKYGKAQQYGVGDSADIPCESVK